MSDSRLLVKEPPFKPEYLFCADLSLRQPGFAILHIAENGRIRIVETDICKNRNKNHTHGVLLDVIAKKMYAMVRSIPEGVNLAFVRERAFSRFARETQALNKVVGVADYLLATRLKHNHTIQPPDWQELAPKSIKAIVAGSGNATKEDVQRALKDYVGLYSYPTSDESDAVAVGVAYAILNQFGRPLHMPEHDGFIKAPMVADKRDLPIVEDRR